MTAAGLSSSPWVREHKQFSIFRQRKYLLYFSGKKEVIEGWEQGIAQMSLGQRAKLTISSDLGYGPRGQGPIPGGATLLFDVELMMIQ